MTPLLDRRLQWESGNLVIVRLCSGAVLTFVAILAFVDGGAAADLPVAPAAPPAVSPSTDWSGLYLGIEGGGGIGSSGRNFAIGTTTHDFEVDGGIAGGTVGYNKQWGNVVAGLEGDFSWSGVGGGTSCPNRLFTCQTNTSWLATVRPRAGYAFGSFMPYITGGLAVGDVKGEAVLNSTGGAANGFTFTKTQFGWTVGGGVELSIYANWSVKAEYLFVRLNDTNVTNNNGMLSTTNFSENVIRGGLNYSFK